MNNNNNPASYESIVQNIAILAKLQVTSEQVALFAKQFEETLLSVKNLQELDTDSISRLPHMTGEFNVYFEDGEENKRNLPPGHYTVPRIME